MEKPGGLSKPKLRIKISISKNIFYIFTKKNFKYFLIYFGTKCLKS